MPIEIHQVDAFTAVPFAGNPAAVCFPPADATDAWLQHVAAEMNLSETAFLWRRDGGWRLRWLTPAVEVDLCGHATLASAHVLFETGRAEAASLRFFTRSGELGAARRDGRIVLDFPATPPVPRDPPRDLLAALGVDDRDARVFSTRHDYLVAVAAARCVRELSPDFRALASLDVRGVIVTAKSDDPAFHFVSRFFAPGSGIDEDPVTGSAHCALGPFWATELGVEGPLRAHQASKRGGIVEVTPHGDRVELAGHAVTVLRGELV